MSLKEKVDYQIQLKKDRYSCLNSAEIVMNL